MSVEADTRLARIEAWGGLLARLVIGGMTALLLLGVLVAERKSTGAAALTALLLAATVAAVAMLLPRPLEYLAAEAAVVSLFTTFVLVTHGASRQPSVVVEAGALLVVIIRVVWKVPRTRLVWLTVLVSAAVAVVPLRASTVREHGLLAVFAVASMIVLVAPSIGIGAYFRALAARRVRALEAARQGERLELARDLHDFVAHHVTGIVVQAQAARYVAERGPEQTAAMFAAIEKSGTEALTSMRRLVGLLRDADTESTRPLGDLDRLTDLVNGFTDPPATLHLDTALPDLAPETAASACRIVQEALTNVRKHAADATEVRVALARVAEGVEVSVRDNGQGRGRLLPSGGYGLAGLHERVQALGGRLHTGPRPEGGWEVVAVL
jgi:signal transduction histidine kinase